MCDGMKSEVIGLRLLDERGLKGFCAPSIPAAKPDSEEEFVRDGWKQRTASA
jgi:hypothetical protein